MKAMNINLITYVECPNVEAAWAVLIARLEKYTGYEASVAEDDEG